MWWGRANPFSEIIPKTITNYWTCDGTAGNQSKWQSWLPVGFDQDCPQHPRINQRTTAMSLKRRRRGGEEGRTEMRHDTAVAQVHERDTKKFETARRWILFLALKCPPPFMWAGLRPVNEQATGPASLPGSLLRLSLYVCLSLLVTPFFCLRLSFFRAVAQRVQRVSEKTLLIYDKMEDSGYLVMTIFSSGFT